GGAARLVPAGQPLELGPQDHRLQRVEPAVAADDDVLVLAPAAVVGPDPDRVGEFGVVGDHRAGVAVCAEVLARVEAGGRDAAEAGLPAVAAGALALGRVLDDAHRGVP